MKLETRKLVASFPVYIKRVKEYTENGIYSQRMQKKYLWNYGQLLQD